MRDFKLPQNVVPQTTKSNGILHAAFAFWLCSCSVLINRNCSESEMSQKQYANETFDRILGCIHWIVWLKLIWKIVCCYSIIFRLICVGGNSSSLTILHIFVWPQNKSEECWSWLILCSHLSQFYLLTWWLCFWCFFSPRSSCLYTPLLYEPLLPALWAVAATASLWSVAPQDWGTSPNTSL